VPEIFRQTPSKCAACHDEPDLHQGEFPADCQECHTTQSWTPAFLDGNAFNHAAQSSFDLLLHKIDYSGQAMRCSACHVNGYENSTISSCVACHSQGEERTVFMQKHQDLYGAACLDCHDGRDRMHGFDHQEHFSLEGKHADLACQECHADKSFAGTPQECAACHAEPSIHAGFFGLKCQSCHTAQAWAPAQLQFHGFPINHGDQGGADCNTCHTDRYTEYTCYNCHEHQREAILDVHLSAGISAGTLPTCVDCHNDGQVHKKQ